MKTTWPRWCQRALTEDFADGPDITTAATVPADAIAEAVITPRQRGVLAGGPVALAVFDTVLGAGSSPSTCRRTARSWNPGNRR